MSIAINIASTSSDVQVVTGRCVVTGWNLRESAGTPAAAGAVLRNGTTTSDKPIARVNFAGDESAGESYAAGIVCEGGVFLDMESGSVEGEVYIR